MAAAKAKAAAKAAASHKKPTGASSGQASAAAKSEPAALPPKDQKVFKEILVSHALQLLDKDQID